MPPVNPINLTSLHFITHNDVILPTIEEILNKLKIPHDNAFDCIVSAVDY